MLEQHFCHALFTLGENLATNLRNNFNEKFAVLEKVTALSMARNRLTPATVGKNNPVFLNKNLSNTSTSHQNKLFYFTLFIVHILK